MRSVIRTSKRPLSALAAALLVVQAVLAAWHGAAMAASRLGGTSADRSIVICTAHGTMRVSVDGVLAPVDPSQETGDRSSPDRQLKCPLCLALAADTWIAPAATAFILLNSASAVIVPETQRPLAHAPRGPPRQRGPPTLA